MIVFKAKQLKGKVIFSCEEDEWRYLCWTVLSRFKFQIFKFQINLFANDKKIVTITRNMGHFAPALVVSG
jgi:hypothetical protein